MTLDRIMTERQGLGEMLKQIRESKGLTQVQLADKTGVTQEYIAKLESGARVNPSLKVLRAFAKALNVELVDLLR